MRDEYRCLFVVYRCSLFVGCLSPVSTLGVGLWNSSGLNNGGCGFVGRCSNENAQPYTPINPLKVSLKVKLRSFVNALSFICLTLSRVSPYMSPRSSKPITCAPSIP